MTVVYYSQAKRKEIKPIALTEAQKRATKKWKQKAVYRVSVDIHRGKYPEVVSRLESCENVSQFIKDALNEKVSREQENEN